MAKKPAPKTIRSEATQGGRGSAKAREVYQA